MTRYDIALQTPDSEINSLASISTLHRFEQQSDRQTAIALHQVLFDQFVQKHKKPPRCLVLDCVSTDMPLHGNHEERFFYGYYYCYLPLYVFSGRNLLVSYLRPGNINEDNHTWVILTLVVKALRQKWLKIKNTFCSDSDFCRWRMLRCCEHHNVN